MYISLCTVCSSTTKCIIKNLAVMEVQDAQQVKLAVTDDELEAALTTGGPIGTTGRKI